MSWSIILLAALVILVIVLLVAQMASGGFGSKNKCKKRCLAGSPSPRTEP